MKNAEEIYDLFKLQWMLDHGYTLTDLINELDKLREDADQDQSLKELFQDWEQDVGFYSEVWPCFQEFLHCEYIELKAGRITWPWLRGG